MDIREAFDVAEQNAREALAREGAEYCDNGKCYACTAAIEVEFRYVLETIRKAPR